MKNIIIILFCVTLLTGAALVAFFPENLGRFFTTVSNVSDEVKLAAATRVDKNAAIELLANEEFAFLVTTKVQSLVYVDREDYSLLLGRREGFLIGKAILYHGVDLAKLDPDMVREDGDTIIIALPPPELLDIKVDTNSLRFQSKTSVLWHIADRMISDGMYSELLQELSGTAEKIARENDLLPSRAETMRRFDTLAPLLSAKIGREIRFEWVDGRT